MSKRIALNAFNMTAAGHQSSGLWRHPQSQVHRYKDLDYWLDLARTLERGRFDAIFLADVLVRTTSMRARPRRRCATACRSRPTTRSSTSRPWRP